MRLLKPQDLSAACGKGPPQASAAFVTVSGQMLDPLMGIGKEGCELLGQLL